MKYHSQNAKAQGVTQKEIVAALTHTAFYAGWPKAWAAFHLAKEVWLSNYSQEDAKAQHQAQMIFPIGEPNVNYAQYFSGQSYLAPISTAQIPIFNVTFEPKCCNHWHIHQAQSGGG